MHDTPHHADDAAVGARRRDDGFDLRRSLGLAAVRGRRRRRTHCGGALLAQRRGCEGGDLRATEDRLERESDAQFQAGCEEGEEAPGRGIEDGIEGEVGLEEQGRAGAQQVGETGVEDGDGDEVRGDHVVRGREEADRPKERARAMSRGGEDEECTSSVNWREDNC